MKRALVGLLSLVALSACKPAIAPSAGAPMRIAPVDWNPRHADVTAPVALVERGDEVVVFGGTGATVLGGGAVLAVDRSVPSWTSAAVVPAPYGDGTWIVGISGDGHVYRLRDGSRFEPVSERFGLETARVHSACGLSGRGMAFLLDNQVAVADGVHVRRLPIVAHDMACGGGALALAESGAVRVIDAHGVTRTFPLANARVALKADGHLLASEGGALYAEDAKGDLRLVREAGDSIVALAATRDGAWFLQGGELGRWTGTVVETTRGARLPGGDAHLVSSTNGVWVVGGGAVARFSEDTSRSPAERWQTEVGPLFDRSCKSCHGPGAGTDLASAGAWEKRRAEIGKRVVEQRSMPPAGVPFDDGDRELVRQWVGAQGR